MRLIDTQNLTLKEFPGDYSGRYAILSHTWEDGETSYQEMQLATQDDGLGKSDAIKQKPGFEKIRQFAKVALQDNFQYIWVDTCCIDKTSSAELSESINSMFRWYSKAARCYVYLADVPPGDTEELIDALEYHRVTRNSTSKGTNIKVRDGREYRKMASLPPWDDAIDHPFYQSRWFTRGWTLQELIAPKDLVFYYSDWTRGFDKSSQLVIVSKITGIPETVLSTGDCSTICVADRMRWASFRTTTRIEDTAYCLLGIFDVNMPMLYGEGEKAFLRLQEEICKTSDDQSIFAWRRMPSYSETAASPSGVINSQSYRGLFARSPLEFGIDNLAFSAIQSEHTFTPPFGSTSIGFNAQLHLIPLTEASKFQQVIPAIKTTPQDAKTEFLAILNVVLTWGERAGNLVGILLKALSPEGSTRQYVRVEPSTVYAFPEYEADEILSTPNLVSLYARHRYASRGITSPDDGAALS